MYYGASSFLNFPRPLNSAKESPTLYVSPADGKKLPVVPDGRRPTGHLWSFQAYVAYKAMLLIPVDFHWVYEDFRDRCPAEKYSELEGEIGTLDVAQYLHEKPSLTEGSRLATQVADAIDCCADMLRGSTTIS